MNKMEAFREEDGKKYAKEGEKCKQNTENKELKKKKIKIEKS